MAKSDAERQAAWRERLVVRGKFFDVMDINRRRLLDLAFLSSRGEPPNVRIVRDFFLAYPLCFTAPATIEQAGDGVLIKFSGPVELEPAAAVVALREAGLAAQIDGHVSEADVSRVEAEVKSLRELGLWSK